MQEIRNRSGIQEESGPGTPHVPGGTIEGGTMKKIALLAASLAVALPLVASPPPPSVRVMTRNVFPGLDNAVPVVEAVFSNDPLVIMTAVEQVWQEVVASNIPARASAVASEIAATRPD